MGNAKKWADGLAVWGRIEEAMDRASISTISELARRLGVSQPTVSGWKSGEHLPDLHRMAEISKLSGLCVQYLWTGHGPRLSGPSDEAYVRKIVHILDSLPESQRDEVLRFAEFHSQQLQGTPDKK